MAFEIDTKRNYPIIFVGFYENKFNKLIVRLTEEYHVTNTSTKITEINMNSEVMKRPLPKAPYGNILKDGTIVLPKIEDMVLVADSSWLGLRRAIILQHSKTDEYFSLYLLDHGQNHLCRLDKIFPILEAYRSSRPQVYLFEVDNISKIIRDEKIDDETSKMGKVQDWLTSEEHKFDMICSRIHSFYELKGNIHRYEKTLLTDENLVEYIINNKFFPILEHYCQLLRFGVRRSSSRTQDHEEDKDINGQGKSNAIL